MAKICDNKSVGILVWNGGKLLMIERKQYNFGYAIPAGHQDGDIPETTAKKELSEEVGLTAEKLQEKLKITLPNPCKRGEGAHHDWTIFEAVEWSGEIKPSADETRGYLWADPEKIPQFVQRLKDFADERGIDLDPKNLPELVAATNENRSWYESPGLEPPMYFLFKKLEII